jgi:type III restriction enzyme
VFRHEVPEQSLEDEDLRDYFRGGAFGAQPVGKTTDSKIDLGEIIREVEEWRKRLSSHLCRPHPHSDRRH